MNAKAAPSKFRISRRGFLTAIAAAGATLALPGTIAQASGLQIDEAWSSLLMDPWLFEVSESGTLVDPGVAEPRFRSDVFDVTVDQIKTPSNLIDAVEGCDPLRDLFQAMAADELDDLKHQLRDKENELTRAERGRLRKLEMILDQDPDDFAAWLRFEGPAGLPRFRTVVENWLAVPIDWDEMESFPRGWGGQGKAMLFFQDLDPELMEAVGVRIVEGDQPGSTYFAAELDLPVDEANRMAERLGVPFRFRAVA